MNKKIPNFHTHTKLCGHATGMPLEYAVQAQKDGCCELGFTDHAPMPDGSLEKYWQGTRMKLQEAQIYIQSVKEAAAAVDFPVHLGFEAEWDENLVSWYKEKLLGEFGAEYLVLGSHWATLGGAHVYCQEITEKEDLFLYVKQTIKAMESGIFKFLAHPDVFMGGWKKWDDNAKSCLKEILDASVSLAMPIEVNGYGIAKPKVQTERGLRFQYPIEEFWEIAAASKAKILCNSDAHNPEDVIKNARKAIAFAEQFDIKPIHLKI